MTTLLFRKLTSKQCAGLSLCLAGLLAGCSSYEGGSEYNTVPPTAPVVTAAPDTPMGRLRTDITDTGPGTPRGDRTSADPSEASTQGAGSRNMVGQPARSEAPVVVEQPLPSGTITDVSILSDTNNAPALVGKPVSLSDVRVQAVVGPRLITVGNGGYPVYIRLPQPMPNLREGDIINLSGTVEGAQATAPAAQNLTGEGAHVLMQQPLFVQANSVQLVRG